MSSSSSSSTNPSNAILSTLMKLKPVFRNAHDAVIIAIHLYMLQRGHRCVALDEGEPIAKELLDIPPRWNASSEVFTFQYSSPDSSKYKNSNVIIKAVVMDNILSVHVLLKDTMTDNSSASNSSSGSNNNNNNSNNSNSDSSSSNNNNTNNSQPQSKPLLNIDIRVYDYISKLSELSSYASLFKDLSGLVTRIHSSIITPLCPPPPTTTTTTTTRNTHIDDDDPLRVPTTNNPYARQPYNPNTGILPDFSGDLMPGGQGGMLMGPQQFGPQGNLIGGRGMQPRFDPYGPVPGLGEPDNDHFRPPTGPGHNPNHPFL